ncbi:MAG: 30S ribosomal protein S20, partial [Actinomycetes bacterium]
ASGDAGAAKLAKEVGKQLDKAVAKGVIHKNQASNKKSAINKKLAKSKK